MFAGCRIEARKLEMSHSGRSTLHNARRSCVIGRAKSVVIQFLWRRPPLAGSVAPLSVNGSGSAPTPSSGTGAKAYCPKRPANTTSVFQNASAPSGPPGEGSRKRRGFASAAMHRFSQILGSNGFARLSAAGAPGQRSGTGSGPLTSRQFTTGRAADAPCAASNGDGIVSESCTSIMTTSQGRSGGFCAENATRHSADSVMTLHVCEQPRTISKEGR